MAYSQKCKSQKRTRSGRIIKTKKCFCCKRSKLKTKAPARKRRNVKKDERPTLSKLENLAKASTQQTQQHKRKLDESSTSDIRKTLSKKSHLIEGNEREVQQPTFQNISENECMKDSANKNDSRFLFGKNPQENQISNDPPKFVELVLNLNENGIGTHLNQELSIDPENQMKPLNLDNDNENQMKTQNKSEKKLSEDLDNKTDNENQMKAQNKSEKKATKDLDNKTNNEKFAQNLSERYYIHDILECLNKKKIQKGSYKKMSKFQKNKITVENLKSYFPRRSLMRDFFDSLNKGQIRNPEENVEELKTEEKKIGPKFETEKRMTEDSRNETKENKSEQNLPKLSLLNDLLNFLNKEQISKLEDNEILWQNKNDKMTGNSKKTPAPKMKNKQSDNENKNQNNNPMEASNLETFRGQKNSKQIGTKINIIELFVDVSQDQINDATLTEERNIELLMKTLEPIEKETNYKDSLQELPLEDEINAEDSLQESRPQHTNNDFLLREYLSNELNFNPPLEQLQDEGPSTEVEENEEIENLEEITVYLTIQDTDIESNELKFEEQTDQNKNTSDQHQNQNNKQNNISSEQTENRNDDQGESDSQSSDQSHSQNNNASKSTENGENKSPGESKTNNENDNDKVCPHLKKIRVFYYKDGIIKHKTFKEEITETEPKPGFSGMTANTNTNTYPNYPSNFVLQTRRTEKTLENQKQRDIIKDFKEGRIRKFSNKNETYDEDECIYCIICGKRTLPTRSVFIDLDEVDYGSLSSEEILKRYWYDEDDE